MLSFRWKPESRYSTILDPGFRRGDGIGDLLGFEQRQDTKTQFFFCGEKAFL